ncbi:hypothetical protein J3B02_002153 [Coemansia erecta]|nr:hypothetical protein J3B02_002153 [Coemansia erecta]KAJ2879696.1 hypothetical protein FB639_003024 [Coemansia asiatica]
MSFVDKIKAKFERLTTSGDDKPDTSTSSSSAKPKPHGDSQATKTDHQGYHHHLFHRHDNKASPYGPETPERMFPEAQHQTEGPSYHDDIGPGGFFAPPRAPTHFSYGGSTGHSSGQDSPSVFNGAMPPFPSQGTYPPYPQHSTDVYPPLGQQPYPPDAREDKSSAIPTSFAQAPYPPLEPASTPQQPILPQSEQKPGHASSSGIAGADSGANAGANTQIQQSQDGQSLARHDAGSNQQTSAAGSLGAGIHTLAPSQVPPGVPLPIGQSDAYSGNVGVEGTHKPASDMAANSGSSGKQMAFLNVNDNETVHQRFLIVCGQVADIKGDQDKVVVHHPFFPPLTFPAIDGYFKVLVELESGVNDLKFVYLQNGASLSQGKLSIKMTPYLDKPPVHLAIMVGSDSKGIFDAPPDARGPGLNDLDAAVRKLRCCAYLWQAYMSEQLYRNGFGRRTFRLEETYEPDTMARDNASRMTARVHVIRSKRTVAEIQDKERAQQWKPPAGYEKKTDESQFSLAMDAVRGYDGIPSDSVYVVCLTLDSRWDPDLGVILGHAAVGGGAGTLRLGVFGSHTTHAWPANAEEVAAKFLDTTKTDTRYLANDCNECGEYWRAANIGMGAFLHECGHMLTLSHTPTGIMSRGFNDYNRTFMARSPNFDGPVKQQDEAGSHWHRVDIIRLRHHPCMRLPTDPPLRDNEARSSGFDALVTEEGVIILNDSGITMVEVWVNNKYRIHREYTAENLERRRSGALPAGPDEMAAEFPQTISVDVNEWRSWAGGWSETDKVQLILTSRASDTDESLVEINKMLKEGSYTDQDGTRIFSSGQLGNGAMNGSEKSKVNFSSKEIIVSSAPKLSGIEIHSGNFIDCIIFHLSDGSQQKIGKGQGGGVDVLTISDDDDLDYITVNSGWWIDGLEFVTRKGKRSGWKGGKGGSMHTMKPPKGYSWMGLSGSGANWLDSLTMLYAKQK